MSNTWLQDFLSRTWIIGDEETVRVQTLEKDYAETTEFVFDFSERIEMKNGDALTGAAIIAASPTGLTIGSPTIDGNGDKVSVSIAGGVASTHYSLRCTANTDNGLVLVGRGNLDVL